MARCSGPYCHIRPASDIGEGAHIGNFVETKKTKVGKGSKANHLTYLGDAEIGAGVNIGAGTITCNYDGVNKFGTVIGDNVFVGSDTTLVAPIEIGKGAYIGAASCVTENVPEDALAVARGRQVNKEGWAKKKREERKKVDVFLKDSASASGYLRNSIPGPEAPLHSAVPVRLPSTQPINFRRSFRFHPIPALDLRDHTDYGKRRGQQHLPQERRQLKPSRRPDTRTT